MDHLQQFECDTPDCVHWKDGACTKPASVTIQEHHCVDYEKCPDQIVIIVVEGGLVQNVYGSEDMKDVQVEILDLDSQEFTHLEEQDRDRKRWEEIKERYTEIY